VNATTHVPQFASFGTSDELQLAENDIREDMILTLQRGSACCASCDREGRELWFGVIYHKAKFKRKGGFQGLQYPMR
jgi:hypothetical protein